MGTKNTEKTTLFRGFCAVHIIGHLIILYKFENVYSFFKKSYFFINLLRNKIKKRKILRNSSFFRRILVFYKVLKKNSTESPTQAAQACGDRGADFGSVT